jgi:aminoglycoside phosphotransferase (APT) family kinase protein
MALGEPLSGVAPAGVSEFRDPAGQLDMAWDRLEEYLTERGHRYLAATGARQFAGGNGNVNFLLEVDGSPWVLRRPQPGPLPPGANDMAREHRVLSGLYSCFPLAPRALLMCDDCEVLGAPFLIMEYRTGLVVREALPAPLEGRGRELAEMLIDTLVALHRVRPEDAGLEDLGRPEGLLERTIEGWCKRANVAADGTPAAAVADLVDWLHDNLVADQEPVLLHNDFKLDNVLLDRADPVRPVAVIDWDLCTRGDPLLDLATLLSYWTESGDLPAMHALAQMPSASPGFLTREAAAERYARQTGLDLSDFVFYRVLALFKLGIVLLQLHARHRRGVAPDPRFAGFRKLSETMLDFALEVAAGKVF